MNGPVQFDSTSTAQTAGVGAAVAMVAVPGDVIALIGDLGAGKTVFVGGMAHGLGLPPQTVSSPTFVIMHEYKHTDTEIPALIHIDAYRLQALDDLNDVGWQDVRDDYITAVEWADRIRPSLGQNVLEIRFKHREDGRHLAFSPYGRWSTEMPALLQRFTQIGCP